jgi:microcystin-dependent protein
MAANFAPEGWAQCKGQLLPINENRALFSLLGTTYGGNGETNFALPNLQGSVPVPMHMLGSHTLGERAGEGADDPDPVSVHGTGAGRDILPPAPVGNAGRSQPHANLEPYGRLSFCIALSGIFPSKN